MPRRTLAILVALLLLILAIVAIGVAVRSDDTPEVRVEGVERRDLVSSVSASGNIRARRQVDISSDISARVITLEVEEGDDVEEGQVLLRLDPTQFNAALQRARASLSQAQAQYTQVTANHLRAERTFERTRRLRNLDPPIVSEEEFEEAQTSLEVAQANLESSGFAVEQAEAGVAEAEDNLSKTIISAPISGKITRLNVEEGETVIVGTMNNPGSLVLSISDLSIIEVVVQVDETDVPRISLGDSAAVEIDAYPDELFSGRITRIGNSAINPPSSQGGSQQAAIDFEVVITVDSPGVELRPDLSATAEIVTETRSHAISVPIIALTVRDRADVDTTRFVLPLATRGEARDVEGVFVFSNGVVEFRPTRVGITGEEHFEILSGVEVGDTVVAGPYQVIRQLADGDQVKVAPEVGSEAPATD